MVTIKIPSIWRTACQDEPLVQVPAGHLLQALEVAVEQYPLLKAHLFMPTGEVNPALNFYINREHVHYRGGLQAPVEEGDEIHVIPMVTGGISLELA
jgi:molybdopterin converting factor small subunit